jgi:hypothetical protein
MQGRGVEVVEMCQFFGGLSEAEALITAGWMGGEDGRSWRF